MDMRLGTWNVRRGNCVRVILATIQSRAFCLPVYCQKIYLLEIGWSGVDWIGLAQDRDKWRVLVNAVMNLRVP
jgi:hypothetical protein